MRREYITYGDNLPVRIQLASIKEYPIHWHKSIEILMVIKGSIDVTIESGIYTVSEREVEIINLEEAHRISSKEDNLVLMFNIDPNFFQKYYDDINNMFFYAETSLEDGPQVDEKYDILKKYLSMILCEVVQKGEDYDEYIEETLIDMLFHLINDFHYLIYEKEALRNNEEQLERYHRIVKYIYNNYNNKISLQDIAKKEFLSTHYLSHEIKNTMGLSFKDFVNLTRVEESIKLLLDTDMTISDISEEMGFSHTRYFNKHFKKHYKLTPMQYRKKYKVDDERLEEIKDVTLYDLKEALEYLSSYVEDYDRYNYEERIIKIDVDAGKTIGDFSHFYKEEIELPEAYHMLEGEVIKSLNTIQEEIDFNHGKIRGIFSRNMGVFNEGVINLKRVKKVFDLILGVGLRPNIILEEEDFSKERYKEVLNYFIDYFIDEYGNYEIGKWKYTIDKDLEEDIKDMIKEILEEDYGLLVEDAFINRDDINATYDTAYMVPYIIHQVINSKGYENIKVIDELEKVKKASNEIFFGDIGIMNWEGLKKPSYYSYYFLNKLGDTLIAKDDGYIVTSKGEDIQVLLYSYSDDMDRLIEVSNINKLRGVRNATEKNISLNIKNLWRNYRVT
ncbi:helix-turn-helix domain-containing protein, partial [Clostridium sp.]|uniref:helix-turn-helix domain-containing protein n=1 Tax=Clostridium sp. TaxID=1506 RepID=UPI00346458AD